MSGDPLANTAAESAAIGVGTFLLKDTRDEKTYLTRRLADGNCWMVQNLDLDLKSFAGKTEGILLTSDNTNLNTKSSWDPGAKMRAKSSVLESGLAVADYQFQDEHSFSSSFLWGSICEEGTGPLANPQTSAECSSIDVANNRNTVYARSYNNDSATATSSGTGNGPAYLTGTQNVKDATTCATYADGSSSHAECTMADTAGNVSTGTNNNLTRDTAWQPDLITDYGGTLVNGSDTFTMRGSMYFGDYYNWYAATAETIGQTTGVSSDDICPKGWRLPVNDGTGSWYKLLNTTYGATGSGNGNGASIAKVVQLPLSIPMLGSYNWGNGNLYYRGHYGYYWTSVGNYAGAANLLRFNHYSSFNPQYSVDKTNGFNIRCVSRGTENQVTPPDDVAETTCAANSICYDANGGTGDTMANTGSATFGSSKVLSAPTYTRTGYAFVGWSESKDAVQSGAYIYGPNETITVPNLSSEGMTLYAQWLAPENSSYTMQAFGRNETVKTCANMTDGNNGTTEERIALRDERDDNVYIVTKLKDGNCWMTSNLALNLADFAGKTTGTLLTPENTDLTASREDLSTLTIEGVGAGQKYYDPGKTMYDYALNLTCGAAPADDASDETKATYNACKATVTPGVTGNYFSIASASLLGTTQSAQFQSSDQQGSSWHWGSKCSAPGICDPNATPSYNELSALPREYMSNNKVTGAYYNAYAASAGELTFEAKSITLKDSICPSGWKIPTTSEAISGSWITALKNYGVFSSAEPTKAIRRQPWNFMPTGAFEIERGDINLSGQRGYYWSSNVSASSVVRHMYMNVNDESLTNSSFSRPHGLSLRCVKRES